MARQYRLMGCNDDFDACGCCGKTGLKRVMMLAPLDPDGGIDGEVEPYGTSCAARLLGYTWGKDPKEQRRTKKLVETQALGAQVDKLQAVYQQALGSPNLNLGPVVRSTNQFNTPIATVVVAGVEFRIIDRGPFGAVPDAEVIRQAIEWMALNATASALAHMGSPKLIGDIRYAFYLQTHKQLYVRA